MASSAYRGILELFRQGASIEAAQRFTALRNRARAQRQEALPQPRRQETARPPEWDGTAYFLVENGRKTGLYCRHCYDTQARLVRLEVWDCATYRCRACQTEHARKLCG